MSFIQKVTSSLQSVIGSLASKSGGVVGIDIGSSSIKVVELRKEHGKIVLATYGETALGPYQNKPIGFSGPLDPDIVATALIDLLKEAKVNTKSAVMTIQSSASLIFVLQLPKTAENSLSEVIPNEARKYIPVPLSDITLNWNIIPSHVEEALVHETEAPESITKARPENIDVLVAAIRNDALSAYKNIGGQVAVTTNHYEIEIFSMIRSTFHHELSPTAIVDFGASQTRIAIVYYGTVMKYHTVNRGGMMLTENIMRSMGQPFERAEELKREIGLQSDKRADIANIVHTNMTALISEIKGTVLDFEKQYHKAIDKVIIVGGGAVMIGLTDLLSQELGVEVHKGDPFKKSSSPDFLENVLSNAGPTFASAMGAALYSIE